MSRPASCGIPIVLNQLGVTGRTAVLPFVDPKKTFDGWKVSLTEKGAFVKYDRVDFGREAVKTVKVQSLSATGGTVEIRLDKVDGPVLARVALAKGDQWNVASAAVSNAGTGVHNLVVTMPEKNDVQLDWVSFE